MFKQCVLRDGTSSMVAFVPAKMAKLEKVLIISSRSWVVEWASSQVVDPAEAQLRSRMHRVQRTVSDI